MRNGVVRQATNRALQVEEFRGFSIADPMAPVIFVNNADSNAAQNFTLAHELAHVWIGQGGISDADLTIGGQGPDDIEEFCNKVAGELLLPWAALNERWRQRTNGFEEWTNQVAGEFHVSTVMVVAPALAAPGDQPPAVLRLLRGRETKVDLEALNVDRRQLLPVGADPK